MARAAGSRAQRGTGSQSKFSLAGAGVREEAEQIVEKATGALRVRTADGVRDVMARTLEPAE